MNPTLPTPPPLPLLSHLLVLSMHAGHGVLVPDGAFVALHQTGHPVVALVVAAGVVAVADEGGGVGRAHVCWQNNTLGCHCC